MNKRNKKGMQVKKILCLIMTVLLILPTFAQVGMVMVSAEEIETIAQEAIRTYEGNGYKVTYAIKGSWTNHQSIEVTLENTGTEKINDWSIVMDTTGNITGLWNAIWTTSNEEEQQIFKCQTYNNTILPGNSVTFGYTLEGENLSIPTNVYLTKIAREMNQGYRVEYEATDDWRTGFQGKLVIVNESGQAMEGWSLRIEGNFTIDNYWNAEIIPNEDGSYTIMHTTWDNIIPAGGSHIIGFVGTKMEETMQINQTELTVMAWGAGWNEEETAPSEEETTSSEQETLPSEEETNSSTEETKPSQEETSQGETETTIQENPTENTTEAVTKPEAGTEWDELTDTDSDGMDDFYEAYTLITDPLKKDSDGNGIEDGAEDFDEDGLINIDEYMNQTDPFYHDSDFDDLEDYDEINTHNTSPIRHDTDGDGVPDGDELILGLDPNNMATNGKNDNEVTRSQTLEADNGSLRLINELMDNPYDFSVSMNAAGVAENNIMASESAYSVAIKNEAMAGMAIEVEYPENLLVEDIQIKFQMDETLTENTSGKYVEYSEEFVGIKRFNVFKYYEDTNMLLPIDTNHDVDNNIVMADVDEMGTYCVMDMEMWFEMLGVEMGDDAEAVAPAMMALADDEYYATQPKFISIAIVLDACCADEEMFNKNKEAIRAFAEETYKNYEYPNLTLVYTKPYGKCATGKNYFNNTYEGFMEDLNAVEFVYEEEDAGIAKAVDMAKNSGKMFVPNHAIFVLHGTEWQERTSISRYYDINIEIWSMEQNRYDYDSGEDGELMLCCQEAYIDNEETGEDKTHTELYEHLTSGEEMGRIAADYLYRMCNLETMEYIVTNSWTFLEEEIDLRYIDAYNQKDYDHDGIWDILEIDFTSPLIKVDKYNYIQFPTLYDCLFMKDETTSGLKRFLVNAGSKVWRRLDEIRVVPIVSDPSKPDTDGDGLLDSAKYLEYLAELGELDESAKERYFYIDDPHPLKPEIVLEWPVVDDAGKKVDTLSSCFEDKRNHGAIDISTGGIDHNVISAADGVVTRITVSCTHNTPKVKEEFCNCNGGLGNCVWVESVINGEIFTMRYCHLDQVMVQQGECVVVGDLLGTVGSTGNSGGLHLDYQIKSQEIIIDPLLFEQMEFSECYYTNIPKSINVRGSGGSEHCKEYLEKVENRYKLEKWAIKANNYN